MAKARPITGLDSHTPTDTNARAIVRERLADMYVYAQYIESPENIQELHDLRIAAKRVRYTLEIFEEFLPETSKDFAEELAKLQDELGALHDSEVMLALLRQLLQQEQTVTAVSNVEATSPDQKQALLASDMTQHILHSERKSALSEKEYKGLVGFLHRQEQRRAQSYASFRQHWEELEQRHFREEILQMLEQRRTGMETAGEDLFSDKENS